MCFWKKINTIGSTCQQVLDTLATDHYYFPWRLVYFEKCQNKVAQMFLQKMIFIKLFFQALEPKSRVLCLTIHSGFFIWKIIHLFHAFLGPFCNMRRTIFWRLRKRKMMSCYWAEETCLINLKIVTMYPRKAVLLIIFLSMVISHLTGYVSNQHSRQMGS